MQKYFITLIFIFTLGFTNATEVQAEDRTSSLLTALRENGISATEQTDYTNLVKKLHSMKINVSEQHRRIISEYLESRNASDLIEVQTSKPGNLTWHFHDVIFLQNDLIFAKYDDGEMFGGDILIKAIFSDNKIADMKTLWNYH